MLKRLPTPPEIGRREFTIGGACLIGVPTAAPSVIRVGASPGPQQVLMQRAISLARPHGLEIELVPEFERAALLAAVGEGRLDATASHTAQELEHSGVTTAFATVTLPFGIYSRQVRSIVQLRDGDVLALPADRLAKARAQVLLYNYRLLFAHEDDGLTQDLGTIVNPRHFRLAETPTVQLAPRLGDAAAAVLPYEEAVAAGLRPGIDSIGLEDGKSPYTQVLAVRGSNRKAGWLPVFARVFQSRDMRRFIYDHYGESVRPPW